jgi:hypothetical protein
VAFPDHSPTQILRFHLGAGRYQMVARDADGEWIGEHPEQIEHLIGQAQDRTLERTMQSRTA